MSVALAASTPHFEAPHVVGTENPITGAGATLGLTVWQRLLCVASQLWVYHHREPVHPSVLSILLEIEEQGH